jgi:hypothetical protein
MAFSYEKIAEGPNGDCMEIVYALNFASVTEGKVETGYDNVLSAVMNNEVSEGQGLVKRNHSDGSTTSYGDVFVAGVTANDTATLVVKAR